MKPILQNRKALAKALGVSRSTLYRMEAAGCPFPAGKCTVQWALDWLKENPNFSSPRRASKQARALLAKGAVPSVSPSEQAQASHDEASKRATEFLETCLPKSL